MKEIEELIKKIIKKTKDKEAVYFYGVEYSSTTEPDFRARIKFSRDGVPPFLAGSNTLKGLKKQLNDYLNGTDIKDIVIQYCLAQIHIEEQAIKFHRDLINDYEKVKGRK